MTVRLFSVKWTATARNDLKSIIRHIAVDNLLEARRVLDRLKHKAESLSAFPERGRVTPELDAVGVYSHREVICNPWRLMYRIESNKVFVVAVLDSRRQLQDLLLRRLTNPPENSL
ncbi:MAG: type II toxin-antitoxin system RelE/ParE family toxin [Gammaproteobacteria bacterium]|jgi:toxin ParE1/3/4|nr:type II toxin-antitoxin system RelE/ParE family toxin [Gammaproteobacteria bacterium]MBT7306844.1 type II toxin-antitoxin system RelE/ParE family toxin [Gammaproteobacteria bacterium]